jgi:DNA invertase Pin-like site-specific DNA recombinase
MAQTVKRGGPPSGGPLRVLGYIRVSVQEQADSGAGLAAQRKAIQVGCAARGYELVEIVEDAGWSGKSLDRPGISSAIERLDRREADALMVAKLDRLSRSLLDFAQLMTRAQSRHWKIVALDLGVDTSTPAGEMMANVLATFSQFERRLIGQRTKEALAAKKAAGVRLGRPRTLSDDVVARMVSDRDAGMTLQQICDRLTADGVPTAQGGRKWDPSVVRRVILAAS